MKARILMLTAAAAVIMMALVIPANTAPAAAQAPTPSPYEPVRSVTVTGVGQVRVVPDQALILIGVETQAQTAREAVVTNNEQMQEVIAALREAGIPADDIQTRNISLYAFYAENAREPRIGGYTARNQVEVRLRQVNQLGDILDAAVMAGANTIDNMRFEVSNPERVLDQARQQAMNDARRKAEQLARLANATLGAVLSITEYSRAPTPFFMETAVMDAAARFPVEVGTETIEVEVQVSWFLQ